MPTSDLSYARMHEIVESGESFIHDGQIISTAEAIPKPETLVVTTADKSSVRAALQAERDALDRRLASMENEGTVAEPVTKAELADAAFAAKKAKAEADAAAEKEAAKAPPPDKPDKAGAGK